jgi:hypothetical protein
MEDKKKYWQKHFTFTKVFMAVFTAIPVLYIWSLPFLNSYFKLNYTSRGYTSDDDITYSISAFIMTPQATGAMGSSFFFPWLFMWHSPTKNHTIMQGGLFYVVLAPCLLFLDFIIAWTKDYTLVHAIDVLLLCVFL